MTMLTLLSDCLQGTSETQNASFLIPFRDTPVRFRSRPRTEVAIPQLRDGEWEWEVERISDTKNDRRGVTKYLSSLGWL